MKGCAESSYYRCNPENSGFIDHADYTGPILQHELRSQDRKYICLESIIFPCERSDAGNMGFVRTEELANQRKDDLRWVIRTYWATCDK